ncbi:probable disease resistance protein At4g27220 [Momordica charantia]|uniref:Probable disease resistance protein At4g27220 n=1 Tax=Momordica charantia TaxID=3673 RepID=A0A6J1CPP4_MOMCH|nr:probable disease resistance protein At4g27220 [Momordica charantia]
MDVFISVGAKVVQYTVAPIGRQLAYLFFYNRNIKDLEKQLENLKATRERVQMLVNEARSNAYEIYDEVSTWLLVEVDVELPNMPRQKEDGSHRNSSNLSCLNFVQRHKLSRKSKKRVKDILQLIEEGKKFEKVGHPAPLPDTKSSTLPADYQVLESRTLMAEKIKDALSNPNVNKVGVCGMAGVGKTKLLDEIKKLVLENKLFDRVIDVTVGRSNGVVEIQDQIGGKLNMGLSMKAETKEGRAPFLRNKLVEMKDKILIMLDDLWNEYDLEKEVGIPCRSESSKEGCKILMTSRSRDILTNKMNTKKCFQVNSLSEDESWKFFMAIVGEFDKSRIEHIAKNVVKKCGGLPIALKIIAKALKGKEIHIWKDAFEKLEKHVLVKIKGVSDQLYSCLKLSYDWIEDEETRLLFLLCSVFPDDHNICVKDLQMYAMGMGLLNDINNWEATKNRVIDLVDDLKSSYLLLESNSGDNYVQMHDVVRDVAKYIASNDDKMSSLSYGCGQSEWLEEDRSGSYNAIFVDCMDFSSLPSNFEFPNLQLLILGMPSFFGEGEAIQIPGAFFEGMEKLRVLDMTKMCFEPSRTSVTHSLKNLQTLCMSYCEYYDIDTIGQLKKLKILKINDCTFEELPANMSQLTQLRLLDLSNCSNLKVIPINIISSMTKLEELNLWRSFKRWGEEISYRNKLIQNVKLSELNHLSRLSNLRLEIPNVNIFSDDLSLERVEKLEEFCICVGNDSWGFRICDGYARRLMVNIKSQIVAIGGTLQILLEGCEQLYIEDTVGFTNCLFKLNGNYCNPRLKHLHIEGNSEMPRRIDVQVSFPELKELTIQGGNNLEMLWHNNRLIANSFCKLRSICISCCNKLTYMFTSNMVTSLVFLNTLEIDNCELLERIFEIGKLVDDAKVLPLTDLSLRSLPNLKYVWNNDPGEFLTFPNLKNVNVSSCPRLKCLFPASFIKHIEEIESLCAYEVDEIFSEDEASKLGFPEIVFRSLQILEMVVKRSFWFRSGSFPKLHNLKLKGGEDDDLVTLPLEMSQELYNIEVKKCDKLKFLLPSSTTFFNLGSLIIEDCNGMMNLFNTLVAKNLVNLCLIKICDCRGITSIVAEEVEEEEGEEIIFNHLIRLELRDLPRLANFYSGKCALKFPYLERLIIEGCPKMKTFSFGIKR